MWMCPLLLRKVHCEDGFRGSNSVEIMNDSEPYEMARALDSDDDRPIGELTESDVEMPPTATVSASIPCLQA